MCPPLHTPQTWDLNGFKILEQTICASLRAEHFNYIIFLMCFYVINVTLRQSLSCNTSHSTAFLWDNAHLGNRLTAGHGKAVLKQSRNLNLGLPNSSQGSSRLDQLSSDCMGKKLSSDCPVHSSWETCPQEPSQSFWL